MPEEWLTYREIGARLGLNVEAVRTRVRRAGWRTQPGNDGRARVLVPDRVFVEPVGQDADRENKTGDQTGLVALLTAAEARISRLEKQMEAERDRVNEARSEADRLRVEVTDLTARAERAEQVSTVTDAARQQAQERAEAAEQGRDRAEADLHELRAHAATLQGQLASAQDALERLRALEVAEAARRARGRWARLRRAWRGE
jgi:chromosome segregation ATPase